LGWRNCLEKRRVDILFVLQDREELKKPEEFLAMIDSTESDMFDKRHMTCYMYK
jgi:hypothetical protein